MTLADTIAIIALILNLVALGVVFYQTHISRESLFAARDSIDATRQSIEMAIKARQLESLSDANQFIIVMDRLTSWQSDLEKITQDLKTARRRGPDDALIERIATQRGLNSPKGLVDKLWHEKCPPWLQMIWMAGAQHYYNCKSKVPLLWDIKKNIPFYDAEDLIIKCNESIGHISELRSYLKFILPTAYLECPAALDDRHFLDD
jgi:hypothetical protein